MTNLTINDYKYILEFYNKPIPINKQLLKYQSEKILVSKLCRCIKKLDKKYKGRAIGICTKTIINNKGFTRGKKFTCKQKHTIHLSKTQKNYKKLKIKNKK
jgi:hypothetical protein